MTRQSRWNPFEEMFSFQRDIDQLFNRFWTDAPRMAQPPLSSSLQVNATDQGWRVDVPLPGIDPQHVVLEASGNSLSIRAEEPGEGDTAPRRLLYEQTVTVPPFLDVDKISATHQHGLLRLSIPLKESVKPRRVPIQGGQAQPRQLTTA